MIQHLTSIPLYWTNQRTALSPVQAELEFSLLMLVKYIYRITYTCFHHDALYRTLTLVLFWGSKSFEYIELNVILSEFYDMVCFFFSLLLSNFGDLVQNVASVFCFKLTGVVFRFYSPPRFNRGSETLFCIPLL